MANALVYLDTTIPSYLTARRSRDMYVATQQQMTHDWWDNASPHFDLIISEAVLAEIQRGDSEMAARRLELVKSLPVIDVDDDVQSLATYYTTQLPLPDNAAGDALHIACAVLGECDYLLTWNCAHIANGTIIRRLTAINARDERFTPTIVTPPELMQTD